MKKPKKRKRTAKARTKKVSRITTEMVARALKKLALRGIHVRLLPPVVDNHYEFIKVSTKFAKGKLVGADPITVLGLANRVIHIQGDEVVPAGMHNDAACPVEFCFSEKHYWHTPMYLAEVIDLLGLDHNYTRSFLGGFSKPSTAISDGVAVCVYAKENGLLR